MDAFGIRRGIGGCVNVCFCAEIGRGLLKQGTTAETALFFFAIAVDGTWAMAAAG
jgi:hypothetical protein